MSEEVPVIAEAAAQALRAKREQDAEFQADLRRTLSQICRDVLRALGINPTGLRSSLIDTDAFMCIIGDSDVSLAVYDNGTVRLVEQIDGQWTRGMPVTSLAQLGELLEARA